MEAEKLLVSFSGGRTSASMAKYIKENYEGEKCFVFANTGKEREETLAFVQECSQQFNIKYIGYKTYHADPARGRHYLVG